MPRAVSRSAPAECLAMFEFYKQQVKAMDDMFAEAEESLDAFVDQAIASLSNVDEPLVVNTPAGHRRLKKRTSKNEEDAAIAPSKKRNKKTDAAAVALATIEETGSERGSPAAAATTVSSDNKVVTPVKPPRRQIAPRLASVNATMRITRNLLEEKKDPTKLRYVKPEAQSSASQNHSEAAAGTLSDLPWKVPNEGPLALPDAIGAVSKRVMEYEENIAVLRLSSATPLKPTRVDEDEEEEIEEEEEEVLLPLKVSKATLKLSTQNNIQISPKVTCTPLNMQRLSILRTSSGTYCLNGTTYLKFQETATGRISGRRRSASDRFKRRSKFGRLSSGLLMESCIAAASRNSVNNADHADSEVAENKAELDEEVNDVHTSEDGAYSDETDDIIPPVAQTGGRDRTSSPAAQLINSFVLIPQVPSSVATDTLSSRNQSCSGRGTGDGTRRRLKRRIPQIDSAKASSAQRERTQALALQAVSGRLEALKMKEEKTLEALKKRDDNMKNKIENQKKKREERLRKALVARQEAHKQKLLRIKEQQQDELKRVQAVSLKKREQEEIDRQQRWAEQRRLYELQHAEGGREREREKILKAVSKAKAEREAQLMKDEREREQEEEKNRREQRIQERQRCELEKKRLEAKQKQQRTWATEELHKKEAEHNAVHLKVCLVKHNSNRDLKEKSSKETTIKTEVQEAAAMAPPPTELNRTFTMEPVPSTSGNVCTNYEITPKRDASKTIPLSNPNNYDIADVKENDSTDDESHPKKEIPAWAKGHQLRDAALMQYYNPPDYTKIFPPSELMQEPKLAEIFAISKPRYFARTSSGNWSSPLFCEESP